MMEMGAALLCSAYERREKKRTSESEFCSCAVQRWYGISPSLGRKCREKAPRSRCGRLVPLSSHAWPARPVGVLHRQYGLSLILQHERERL